MNSNLFIAICFFLSRSPSFLVWLKSSICFTMVERKVCIIDLYNCNSNWSYAMALWNKIYNGVDTRTLDFKVYCFLFIICHISFNDLVLSWRISIYAKNNNLHNSRIYNSYDSIVYEMITLSENLIVLRVSNKRHLSEILKTPPSNGRFLFLRLQKRKK